MIEQVKCASCGKPVEHEQYPWDPAEWFCDACHELLNEDRRERHEALKRERDGNG
jgi:predicted nucleic acid-binding Zn ribbon protein